MFDKSFNNKSESTPSENRIRVLKLIRNKKEITRADIIDQTGLSAPTITRIIEALLEMKLIVQDEVGSSNGGRPPQIIKFDYENNYVIGIDIGGTFLRAAFSNLDGEFLYEIKVPTEVEQGFDGVMKQIGEMIQRLLNRAKSRKSNVFGIGVSVCGIMNKQSGMLEYSPVLDWKNVDIRKALSEYTDLEISIGNVANLISLGELYYGVGTKFDDFISINLEYGIGSGIIIDRKLFEGANGHSGEIGHIVVNRQSSLKGREGIEGTLEALASGYGIADIVNARLKKGEESILNGEKNIDSRMVLNAAMNGDKLALEVIEEAADYIGISIDILIKLFNTQAVVLSGGFGEKGDFFNDKIRNKVRKLSLQLQKDEIPILVSSFGTDANLMGAFSLILQNVLHLES
jgi:glucokinase-like ROK family protein